METAPVTPDPTDPAAGTLGGTSKQVLYQQGEDCMLDVVVDCPPEVSCNPPPPRKMACPPHTAREIQLGADGVCLLISDWACPEDWTCETPYQQAIDCPEGLASQEGTGRIHQNTAYGCEKTIGGKMALVSCPEVLERPLQPGFTVSLKGEGLCWAEYETDCPPNARCNPPAPIEIICP